MKILFLTPVNSFLSLDDDDDNNDNDDDVTIGQVFFLVATKFLFCKRIHFLPILTFQPWHTPEPKKARKKRNMENQREKREKIQFQN